MYVVLVVFTIYVNTQTYTVCANVLYMHLVKLFGKRANYSYRFYITMFKKIFITFSHYCALLFQLLF